MGFPVGAGLAAKGLKPYASSTANAAVTLWRSPTLA
ncbi:hypothetical protein EMIT0P12_80243 [Pseudomonas sp. IT-P12]